MPQTKSENMSILNTNKDRLIALTLLAVAFIYVVKVLSIQPLHEFHTLVAIYLVFFTPGYFFSSLIFFNRTIDLLERIAISIALSLFVLPTVYLLLYILSGTAFNFSFSNAILLLLAFDVVCYLLYRLFSLFGLPKLPFAKIFKKSSSSMSAAVVGWKKTNQ